MVASDAKCELYSSLREGRLTIVGKDLYFMDVSSPIVPRHGSSTVEFDEDDKTADQGAKFFSTSREKHSSDLYASRRLEPDITDWPIIYIIIICAINTLS